MTLNYFRKPKSLHNLWTIFDDFTVETSLVLRQNWQDSTIDVFSKRVQNEKKNFIIDDFLNKDDF